MANERDELPTGFQIVEPAPAAPPAAAELPPGFTVDRERSPATPTDVLAQGVAFGFADEIAGAAAVTADKALGLFGRGSGRPAVEVFEEARAAKEQAIQDVPAAVRVPTELLGGLLTGGTAGAAIVKGATKLPAITRPVVAGAAEGAVVGAGTAQPGERAGGAALGATAGTVLGIAVPLTIAGITKAVTSSPALRQLGSAGKQAARRTLEALKNDDITLEQAAARLNRLGPEAIVADVGEENVKQLAQAVTGTAGKGRRLAGRVLDRRSRSASRRVVDAVRGVVSGDDAADVSERLMRERSAAAGPKYTQALAVGEIDDPVINRLIGRPVKPLAGITSDIRDPVEDIGTVLNSNFNNGRVLGRDVVGIGRISGGVSQEVGDQRRVQKLVEEIKGGDGFFARIIVDADNNVIEGAHRIEALRRLGAKEVPVFRMGEATEGFPAEKMRSAVQEVGGLRAEQVRQIVADSADMVRESGTAAKVLSEFEFPAGFEAHFKAAINAAGDAPKVAATTVARGSAPLVNAIKEAKRLDPDLADLPDNHMVLLDKAYKALGGKANKARVSGDGTLSNSLNDIRVRFRERLVGLNPAYGDALDTFAGRSSLIDALDLGRDVFKPKAGVTAKMVDALSDSEREMFKVGLADALVDRVERGVTSSAAKRLLRTPKIERQIKAAFGDDLRAFREFKAALLKEIEFARTSNIRFGSRTAPLESEVGRLARPAVEAADAVVDVAGGGSPARSLLGLARRATTRQPGIPADVNEELGRLLFTPGADLSALRLVEENALRRIAAQSGVALPAVGGANVLTQIEGRRLGR